jgi:hypothetical protein
LFGDSFPHGSDNAERSHAIPPDSGQGLSASNFFNIVNKLNFKIIIEVFLKKKS